MVDSWNYIVYVFVYLVLNNTFTLFIFLFFLQLPLYNFAPKSLHNWVLWDRILLLRMQFLQWGFSIDIIVEPLPPAMPYHVPRNLNFFTHILLEIKDRYYLIFPWKWHGPSYCFEINRVVHVISDVVRKVIFACCPKDTIVRPHLLIIFANLSFPRKFRKGRIFLWIVRSNRW